MNIIDRLEDLVEQCKEIGIDPKPISELLDYLYVDDVKGKPICKLIADGVCIYVLGEECEGYGELDNCVIRKAGLFYCSEHGELVDKLICKECNENRDCGCCDSVRNGWSFYTCQECGRKKVETKHGIICFDPRLSEKEIAEEIERCNENPSEYFRC